MVTCERGLILLEAPSHIIGSHAGILRRQGEERDDKRERERATTKLDIFRRGAGGGACFSRTRMPSRC